MKNLMDIILSNFQIKVNQFAHKITIKIIDKKGRKTKLHFRPLIL